MSAASLDSSGRCALCLEGTRGFDAAYSFGAYDGRLRDLIHLFKYAGVRSLAKPLGRMANAALPRTEPVDLIVPVPMHWLRRWRRGFNQAESLARVVSRRTGLGVCTALRRTRKTAAQAVLTHAERRENLAGVFRVPRPEIVRGKTILLMDDVFTTGATASACAQVLKKAGAKAVILLTLARVDRRWAEPSGRSEKFSGDS